MQPELQPIVRRLGMEGDGSVYRGRTGDIDVVAMLTTIGMPPAPGRRSASWSTMSTG